MSELFVFGKYTANSPKFINSWGLLQRKRGGKESMMGKLSYQGGRVAPPSKEDTQRWR
jgi:hypothetical protein